MDPYQQGRHTGVTGNIIWLHGIEFHGLQAMPLYAWFLEQTRQTSRHLLHRVGALLLLAILTLAVQTWLGHTLFELSVLPIVFFVLVAVWEWWRGIHLGKAKAISV